MLLQASKLATLADSNIKEKHLLTLPAGELMKHLSVGVTLSKMIKWVG